MEEINPRFPVFRIGSADYVDAVKLLEHLGITRQTLWNWRRTGKVPVGCHYRNRVVFSKAEVREIEAHAHQLAPAELSMSSNRSKGLRK